MFSSTILGKGWRSSASARSAWRASPIRPTREGKWAAVKVKPKTKLPHPVTLKQIKAEPKLADCELVKLSRLSVAEIKPDEWSVICSMAGI